MLGVALKIPEIIMLLLINTLRCLMETQKTTKQMWRAISVTKKMKESQSPSEVYMYYLSWCCERTINGSTPKPISTCCSDVIKENQQYCVSIVSLVSARPQIVSWLLLVDAGLRASEINRPGPNRETLSFKKYNVPTWEFWQKRDVEGKINTGAKLEFCWGHQYFFNKGC